MEKTTKAISQTSLWPNQSSDGTDLARLRANLNLTPTERVEKALAVARFQYEVKVAAQTAGLRRPS